MFTNTHGILYHKTRIFIYTVVRISILAIRFFFVGDICAGNIDFCLCIICKSASEMLLDEM